MVDEWRDVTIPGYEDKYQVSSEGGVRSKPRVVQASNRVMNYPGRPLKVNLDSRGYAQVCLCDHTRRTTVLVHRLVALSFLGEPQHDQEVCHENGVRADNRLANIRWGTRSENTKDKIRHGTHNWLVSRGGRIPDYKEIHD